MASDDPVKEQLPQQLDLARLQDGPYVLRTLLEDVPLSADGPATDVKINCVEYFDHNLYVGTSASELLHFVQIPPDPSDPSGRPTFILASRLQPPFAETNNTKPGVQQILLLPRVSKACILCNWTVTFYSLPELSPVFGTTQVKNCNWVGGVDLNDPQDDPDADDPVTILLSLNRRIQVVRIGDDPRAIKNIDVGGSTISVRRDTIACVADARSYSLLDVTRQLKIPLMTISSLDDSQPGGEIGQAQNITGSVEGGILRSVSAVQNRPLQAAQAQGHSRSTSLGGSVPLRPSDSSPPTPSASPQPPHGPHLPPPRENDKPLPEAPTQEAQEAPPASEPAAPPKPKPVFLKPHIVSPTPDEFLLVTGTGLSEPGIGLFVNLDGDPTRPTVEFERYPREVVVDGGSSDLASSQASPSDAEEGYLLASMAREVDKEMRHGIEIQRWDGDGSEPDTSKFWLEAESIPGIEQASVTLGIRSMIGEEETHFSEIVDRICQRKFSPFSLGSLEPSTLSLKSADSRTASSLERVSRERELFDRDNDTQSEESLPDGWQSSRNAEEEAFVARFAKTQSRVAVWAGNHIWWAVRNPILLQLEARIDAACTHDEETGRMALDRRAVFTALNSIRGREPKTELEFVTFSYIRQRAAVLLFGDLLQPSDDSFSDGEVKALEEVLLDSALDARVILSLVPGLQNEIIESKRGTWVFSGVKKAAEQYLRSHSFDRSQHTLGSLDARVIQSLRRFLGSWRKKKDFGSIPDKDEVLRSVDAALLIVLLELDRDSPRGIARSSTTIRAELNEVVDKGVDCFDRAVSLFESYHRLFVLSRLYQSRKMAGDVLAVWRRIIEGERDDGGELRDGEQRVREYLMKISSQALVQEYGLWLANRNPKLGVQVFAEDKGRAPKFEPTTVVALLRAEAPAAVKYYLEHLVFGKGHTGYVNDLITYYLDIVTGELHSSPTSREAFAATYDAYRALQAPKSTYRHFLTDNAPKDDEVWQSRLRLLQLLGGTDDYNAATIRTSIESLPGELLVPEIIILDGRERRHEDAIRLLVHKLGDYDTAVSYCLRGGSSIYTPLSRGRKDSMPTHEMQARLFRAVLGEFLTIADVSERVEQTGALLERFGGWFEIDDILGLIPDGWSVDIVAGFLVRALRRLVQEKHESSVMKALSSAENLRVNHELIARVDEMGPTNEAAQ
ncbi:Transforming growth factor-beta receptor-associated protein 1 like [Verticillium longisporum]|uniref:Transforming growth factor-beta receptor-associated protein 1 like n=1 Tax=Verticillium longisporum TaxID=100787 RepID=A0A8I2ZI79_VERLO|nr:Transforming growth factor-beta receptor-associated protein 1 like [Verticillium longisporum]KAG7129995.1 Transforming growth factor-beta receptor-associated protein 1 like [Verticillium longisporum]